MSFILAIAGRPNVGKSTLYNRLAGKRLSIVNDTPGVTRDWRSAPATLFGRDFMILDTAGLEERFDGSIPARMRQQTEAALDQADAILFMIDGRAGITPMDSHFADFLRKQKKPVILAVNKCEHAASANSALAEAYGMGFGDPIALSAEHGTGMDDLFYALEAIFPHSEEEAIQSNPPSLNPPPPFTGGRERRGDSLDREGGQSDEDMPELDAIEGLEAFEFTDHEPLEKSLKIAIVGRPNVGKSTLLNAIVGHERSMTGPEAGITRDAVAVEWVYNDKPFRLVDTAGMRRKARVQDTIEKLSVEDSLRAIRLAQVVVLVLDAASAFEKQDIQIADLVLREGRALVVAINKWDAVLDRKKTLEDIQYKFETALAQVKKIPFVTLSALNAANIPRLLDTIVATHEIWNRRIKTAGLNRWLANMESRNAPPLVNGRSNRLKYITQIKTRPPTFALWVSREGGLPDSYKRYLLNALRDDFDLPGVPVRLLIRQSNNPFK